MKTLLKKYENPRNSYPYVMLPAQSNDINFNYFRTLKQILAIPSC